MSVQLHVVHDDSLPPDPIAQTKHRMAELAQDQAKNMAMRQVTNRIKSVLPRFLHPLIPGERGTVGDNVIAIVRKRFWAAVGSLIFSLVFFAAFAFVTLFVVAAVGFALLTS